MKELKLEIIPLKGYGELNFGDDSEHVITYLGAPEEVENLEDEDVFQTVILYYWEKGITVFFEGRDRSVVSCFESENTSSTMFGKEIFTMDEKSIIDLMNSKGYEVAETEMETSGEKRVSYDDAMIDFFFMDDKLVAVNWGVLVNEKGEVETSF